MRRRHKQQRIVDISWQLKEHRPAVTLIKIRYAAIRPEVTTRV
jgi:hypothetical protein